MSLIDRVNDELKAAMRAKDKLRLDAVRALRGEIIKLNKSGTGEATDEQIVKAVKVLIKQRQDAMAMYQQAGRDELRDVEAAQITVLAAFLPPQLTAAELQALVAQAVAETGAANMRDMGKTMSAVQALIAASGKDADGRAAAAAVKAALS